MSGGSTAPSVAAVYVSGSTWHTNFKNYLAANTLGHSTYGFLASNADPQNELPWINVDRVSVTFTEQVEVAPSDLLVKGVNNSDYPTSGFVYDEAAFTATWSLPAALPKDKLVLHVANFVADDDGERLPIYQLRLNPLPGDADRSGRVNAIDKARVKAREGLTTSNPTNPTTGANYTPYDDVNGSADINGTPGDGGAVDANLNATLPAGEPTPPAVPQSPSGLSAHAGTGGMDLSWASIAGASYYAVYRADAGGSFGSAPLRFSAEASATDFDVQPGTTYTYRVTAANDAGEGAASLPASALSPPPAPASLTATASASGISLTWGASTTAQTYTVYRAAGEGPVGTTPYASGISSTTFVDAAVANGTTYSYAVAASNAGGTGERSHVVTTISLPAAPASLTAGGGRRQVSLAWSAVASATTYSVYRGSSAASLSLYRAGLTRTTLVDAVLPDETTYYYAVAAANAGGDGLHSPVRSASTADAPEPGTTPPLEPPVAPGGLNVQPASDRELNLSWADNSDNETGFVIERLVDGQYQSYGSAGANSQNLTVPNLAADTTYSFRIAAGNAAGTSAFTTGQGTTLADIPSGASDGFEGDSSGAAISMGGTTTSYYTLDANYQPVPVDPPEHYRKSAGSITVSGLRRHTKVTGGFTLLGLNNWQDTSFKVEAEIAGQGWQTVAEGRYTQPSPDDPEPDPTVEAAWVDDIFFDVGVPGCPIHDPKDLKTGIGFEFPHTGEDLKLRLTAGGAYGIDHFGVSALDEPVVSMSVTGGAASEQGPTHRSFTISRTGLTNEPLTVSYAVSGTAISGADFTGAGETGSVATAQIPANQSSVTVPLNVIDDQWQEGDEVFYATTVADAKYRTDGGGAGIVIADNDATTPTPTPTVSVSATDATATEPWGTLPDDPGEFALTRTGDRGKALTVYFNLSGSALNGIDYALPDWVEPVGGGFQYRAKFAGGEDEKLIQLSALPDGRVENLESSSLALLSDPEGESGTPKYAPSPATQAAVDVNERRIAFLGASNQMLDPARHGLNVSNFVTTDQLPENNVRFGDVNSDPDNFRIEISDPAAKNQDSISVRLGILREGAEIWNYTYHLTEKSAPNTSVFRSSFLRLVTDDIDDNASGSGATSGDPNRHTLKVKLGDVIQLKQPGQDLETQLAVGRPPSAERNNGPDQLLHEIREIKLKITVLRNKDGDPTVSKAQVLADLEKVNERFAQSTIRIADSATIDMGVGDSGVVLPPGVNWADGFDQGNFPLRAGSVSPEEQAIAALNDNDPKTIDVFYTDSRIEAGKPFTYIANVNLTKDRRYSNNIIMNPEPSPFTLAHELMHVLLNKGHRMRSATEFQEPSTALFHGVSSDDVVNGRKRIGPYPDAVTAGVGNGDTEKIRLHASVLPV